MILANLEKDIITSMKSKDSTKVNSLRFAKSLLIENAKSVKPREEIDVLLSYKKTLEKSLESFVNYAEETAKINYDIAVVSEYLPVPMTNDDIIKTVLDIKLSKNLTDFSSIMKESMIVLKGKADGKNVISIIKEILK